MSTPNDNKPVCPNCGQYQHPHVLGGHDCMNECIGRGLAPRKAPQPQPPQGEQDEQLAYLDSVIAERNSLLQERDALQSRVDTLRETADRATVRADALQAQRDES